MKKRNIIIILVFALAIAAGLLVPGAAKTNPASLGQGGAGGPPGGASAAGGATGMEGGPNATEKTNVFSVRTSLVERTTIQDYIKLNGDVVVDSTVEAYPDTSGKLVSLKVYLGSRVSKGDLIAEIDPSKPGATYARNPVYAPISGTVTSLPLHIGATVTSSTVIATIGDIDRLQVDAKVPEPYVGVLKKGLKASVSLEAYPGEAFAATVTRLSPVVDATSRTKEIRLSFDRFDDRINAGMFARVKLNTTAYPNSLAVADEALVSDSEGDYVFVVKSDNTVSKQKVLKGVSVDGVTEIRSGLEESQVVVVEGASVLSDGAAVKNISSQEATR